MLQPTLIAESELIAKCKIGDFKYQELLYKRFYGFAMGISIRYSLNREDAIEAVNDSFIKAFKSIKNYNTNKPFKSWLSTIIINTAIDKRRAELKYQLHTDLEGAVFIHPSNDSIERLDAQDILKLLKLLPPIQSTVFNLFEIDGYSHEEISQTLNIATSSSRVYLTRAKEKLRKLLLIITYNERRSVK